MRNLLRLGWEYIRRFAEPPSVIRGSRLEINRRLKAILEAERTNKKHSDR